MIEARTLAASARRWALFVLFVFAALFQFHAANAQGERPNNIRLELVAEEMPKPGETVMVALHFQPVSDEWHGYWSNPGDAGVGMMLDWELPPGWEAGEPQYPVPKVLEISGLINHVYEGDYAVLVPLKVSSTSLDPSSATVSVKADYLACTDRICVPETASPTLQFDRVAAPEQFAGWSAAIAPLLDSTARLEMRGGKLRIAIPLPEGLALNDPHVFLAEDGVVDYGVTQTFAREGDVLVAELTLQNDPARPGALGGILSFGGGEGVRFTAERGEVPTGLEPLRSSGTDAPLLLLILGALAGGLILNVMPCVFPILSLKAMSLVKASVSEGAARQEGLAYTAGAVLACTALGALLLILRAGGEQIGWAFQLQEPGVVAALLVLAAVLTANFAGVFELPTLPIRRGGEPLGAFVTGLLAAFVATPCTGPFMAAALGAALILPPLSALALFAALGLGLALPFLLLGFVPALRKRLPRPGPWMERFRHAMAIPMGLTALALVWLTVRVAGKPFALLALLLVAGVLLALAVTGRLQRAGKLAWPAFGLIAAPFAVFAAFALPAALAARADSENDPGILAAQPFSESALAEARAANAPVFVYFTADWCVSCKVNEAAAIEREATREAFEEAGVTTIRGDWTRRDPEITRFLSEQGTAGVPLYLWYPAGASEPERLPQLLSPDLLPRLARQAYPTR
ncbi:protein-disulfide reductase DsbD family protein [Qipengyuania atrilutea]|uniref:Thioredoxin family protein n=1 Tax=Qipengyuania atrilutea TaxID=2744473 RepID=A0A850GZY3_9SPHN|nr:thioredoxin family protein [Actirhodobacter atriluteus]NVD43562.1 thioredoxin family protein [Actirhodobacter atriluteus]